MSPGTEFASDFCAGIGPLQLGVVLVLVFLGFFLQNVSGTHEWLVCLEVMAIQGLVLLASVFWVYIFLLNITRADEWCFCLAVMAVKE